MGEKSPMGYFLIGGRRFGEPWISFICLLRFTGEREVEKGPRWAWGSAIQSSWPDWGRVIYKAKPQMLLPEKSPDQNSLL